MIDYNLNKLESLLDVNVTMSNGIIKGYDTKDNNVLTITKSNLELSSIVISSEVWLTVNILQNYLKQLRDV